MSIYFYFSENVVCPSNYVKCPNSYCLATNKVCDGVSDCPFGEDEHDCGRHLFIKREFIQINKQIVT